MRPLRDGFRTYVLRDLRGRLGGAPVGDELSRPANREDARAILGRLARDSDNAFTLRRLLAATAPLFAVGRLTHHEVVSQIAQLWTSGRISVIRLPAPRLPPFAVEREEEEAPTLGPAAMPAREEPRRDKTWIEVELLDERGSPVAGEPYRIKLTDGNTYSGRLDRSGTARHAELDPGECAVWFPRLYAKQWEPQRDEGEDDDDPASDPPRSPRRTWIEIELLDEDGEPVAGETYEITLPNGAVFHGRLDDEGTAFHGDLDPGQCTVTFPRLGPRAWEEEA